MSTAKAQPATKTSNGAFSVPAAAEYIGISERSFRSELRRTGTTIPFIKLGGRYLIPKSALDEWLRNAGKAPAAQLP